MDTETEALPFGRLTPAQLAHPGLDSIAASIYSIIIISHSHGHGHAHHGSDGKSLRTEARQLKLICRKCWVKIAGLRSKTISQHLHNSPLLQQQRS